MMNLERALQVIEASSLDAWTVQGFGMLRMYPPSRSNLRLNFWHSCFRTAPNSMIHNHVWDFRSTVLRGSLRNIRYIEDRNGTAYQKFLLQPGESGGLESCSEISYFSVALEEVHGPGHSYSQRADEIHQSLPTDGTLTVNKRVVREKNNQCLTFCPYEEDWQSAEPRPATLGEVNFMRRCLQLSLLPA